jgi:uncharacterized protein YuzE
MRITIDETAGAVYMKVRDGKVAESVEVTDADAYVDLDADGYVLGVEFLSLEEYEAFERARRAHTGARVPERIEDPTDFRLSPA